MIDPHHIIHTACRPDTLFPPTEVILFHNLPVIDWIAPLLSIIRKCIRRASCYIHRMKRFIQLILSGICPHICTVQCYINRNISYDLYSFAICIFLQRTPLLKKLILHKTPELNLLFQKLPVIFQCRFLTESYVLIPGQPFNSTEIIFARHKKTIILQPVPIFIHKVLIIGQVHTVPIIGQICFFTYFLPYIYTFIFSLRIFLLPPQKCLL